MAATHCFSLMGLLICTSAAVCNAGGLHHIGARKSAQVQRLSGYEARTKLVGLDEAHTRLQIYNRKTGRVTWSRRLGGVSEISWSADHRAAVIVEAHDAPQHRILVWQAGQGVRIISRLPIITTLEQVTYHRNLLDSDSLMQATLSPDGQRILVRASWTQGGGAVDNGALWCLTLKTRRLRYIYPSASGPAHWLSSSKIFYKQWNINETKGEREDVAVTQLCDRYAAVCNKINGFLSNL